MSGSRSGTILLVYYPLVADDYRRYLEEGGFSVEWLVASALTVPLLSQLCRALRPRFLASINFSPELAFVASQVGTPYVSLTIDPLSRDRLRIHEGTDPKACFAFSHRRAYAERFSHLGFARSEYLPLGASPRRVVEAPSAPKDLAVSFVGNSLAREEVEFQGILAELSRAPRLGARLEALVTEGLERAQSDPEFSGLDEAQLRSIEGAPLGDAAEALVSAANGALSHRYRIRHLQALLPFGLAAYGDDGLSSLGKAYLGPAHHGEELTSIYQRSRLNLDLPRIYQRDIVTMRVFDILAAGGLVLTEESRVLRETLPDCPGIITFRDRAELHRQVEWALSRDNELSERASAGREQVLGRHLLTHRFDRIEEVLRAHGI